MTFSVRISIISLLLYMANIYGILFNTYFQIFSSAYCLLSLRAEYCARYHKNTMMTDHSALRELTPKFRGKLMNYNKIIAIRLIQTQNSENIHLN